MASLRARLALPLAERPQPGPPPSFQTSLIEDLRRELQTPPLERARAAPEPLPNSDRPAPQAREDSAPAVDVPPLGAGGPDRADPPGPFGTGPAGAIMQADAAAPGTRASIDLHL
ncbi:MAG: hypothetical protein JJU42_14785 [Rhodobacteraceae bacterium]|nr:hypothetical protein [Paracoccaceae bacterium]